MNEPNYGLRRNLPESNDEGRPLSRPFSFRPHLLKDSMTEEQLNQWWRDLCRAVRPDDEIKTWSYEGGYGIPFKIWDVTFKKPSIIVYSSTIKDKRTITKNEFLLIAPRWVGYRDDGIGRDVMQTKSQNTSYIFGMLKWLEDRTAAHG
ncbi:hypothetical protein [Bradyrhizobium septentrionale]|uniref:Uncharacterized protein n=1 Tax=Bradyrhizobium septentrionale TaxID=1404411 RepID=A0A973W6G7_9BRAD|nr:hypothetical protein [Bradyrhizobium septentrionale]UGY16733.1 hypothetical protein HAP48_0004050 [Bradyrhizobium septentrionale]